MKNARKIGIVLLLVAVIAVGIATVIASGAEKYTGTVDKLEQLVDKAAGETVLDKLEAALVAVEEYLESKPVDPNSQGYAEVMAAYRAVKINAVSMYIDHAGKLCTYTESGEIFKLSDLVESVIAKDPLAGMDPDSDEYKEIANSDEYEEMMEQRNADVAKFNQVFPLVLADSERACFWFNLAFVTDADKNDGNYGTLLASLHSLNMELFTVRYKLVDQEAMAATETDTATAEADGNYKLAKKFFKERVFDADAEDYADAADKLTALETLYTQSKNARYQALIAQAKMSDYGKKPAYKNDFEGTSSNLSVSNYSGYDKVTGMPLKNSYGKKTVELGEDLTNTYFEININGARNQGNTGYLSTYFTLSFAGTVDCFVMEMDFTSFTTLPSSKVYFQSRPSAGTATWMAISPQGHILDYNDNILVENAIVPGEWTHITIICDMENIKQSKLYLDYAFAATIDGDPKNYDYIPESMRIGNSPYASGQMCVDNVNIGFTGSVCDQNYFTNMSKDDQFLYYCDYMYRLGEDEKFIEVPDCIMAYDKAKELIDLYGKKDPDTKEVSYTDYVNNLENDKGEPFKAAVNKFFAYDPTEIVYNFKVLNLSKYKTHIETLETIVKAPTSASITNRNKRVSAITNFVNANAGYILDEKDDNIDYTYEELLARYSAELTRIEQDRAILNFITTMDGFQSAVSATLLKSNYNKATQMIADGLNTDLLDVKGYEAFKKHYEVNYPNGPAKIALAISDANAKALINSINYLTGEYPDEADWKLVYIENPVTEADLKNNEQYTYIENYVNLIRGIIVSGDYNTEYSGVDTAIQKFADMNDYYYNILQSGHVEFMNAQFELFAKTDSFIEKQGIISYIQRYLNSEDVDFSVELACENVFCSAHGVTYNGAVRDVAKPACPVCDEAVSTYKLKSPREDISAAFKKYTAYVAELGPQRDDYETLLNVNTVYFVNTVKKFDTAITYVEKLALLNEAMPFYYAMNISSDEVLESIAKYDALAAELRVVEDDSKEFIENVLLIATAEEPDLYYGYLVAAAALRDKVDASIEGVPEAIEAFDAALADYNNVTGTVNSEIADCGNTLGSLSASGGFSSVLSVVLKVLFGFAD